VSEPSDHYEPTFEELQRMVVRKSQGMQILADRVGVLTLENVELMTIITELQDELSLRDKLLSELQESAAVESGHGVVHALPDDEAGVPGG
jgi:hypothetical protein